MNIKESLLQALLGTLLAIPFIMATSWVLQRFLGPVDHVDGFKPGQSIKIKNPAVVTKPLKIDVDFIDKDLTVAPEDTVITAGDKKFDFSTAGGAVCKFAFDHLHNGTRDTLTTLEVNPLNNRESLAFLVALEEPTPFTYTLTKKAETENAITLVYHAESPSASIEKTFEVQKQLNTVSCILHIIPHNREITPRLFLPGPYLTDLDRDNNVQALVMDEQDTLRKYPLSSISETAWVAPSIVGIENRFFIHALVKDTDNFTQRAYYRFDNSTHLTTILEGPAIKEPTTWHMTFYIGPKIAPQLNAVDPRLESTLEYGWFAPVARLLLAALMRIHELVPNYGWSIVIITILLSLFLIPFNLLGGSLAPNDELNKKLKYIDQKYKHDKEALARERLAAVQKYGDFGSIKAYIPLILQIVMFVSLYRVLTTSVQMYHSHFLWVPDLSARDPYYILPLLFGAGVFLQMASSSKDPRQWTAALIVGIVLAGFMGNLAAGLILYLVVSTFFRIVQQSVVKEFAK
jgi:YidC/Oxa1 family membrane protein insertase